MGGDDFPDKIQVWRSTATLEYCGTWSTTRYPEDAVTYRRALPAASAEDVRAGALVWIAIDDDDCEVETYAMGFRYWIFKSGAEEFTLFSNAWEKGHYPTIEAAKAAAQADYEARILAALEAPDAGVAELVEALRNDDVMTVGQAAKVLLEDRDALTHFAIMVMRNNRLKDGKRIGYQPAIVGALQRLIDEEEPRA